MRQVHDMKRARGAWRWLPGAVLLAVLLGTAGTGADATPPPSTQPLPVQVEAGYQAVGLDLKGSALAVSPAGRAAVAQDAADGGATIAVYDRLGPGERKLLQT